MGKNARNPCWCKSAESEITEVQCSSCQSWVHYNCMGLMMRELCQLVNSPDACIYICKTCNARPDADNICKELIEARSVSEDELHRYNEICYNHVNTDITKAVYNVNLSKISECLRDIKLGQESVSDLVAAAIPTHQGPRGPSYAAISTRRGSPPQTSQSNSNAFPSLQSGRQSSHSSAVPRLVSPERSIVIDKISDPKRFSDSLALK